MKNTFVVFALLFSTFAVAELPDAPSTNVRSVHKFMDRQAKIGLALRVGFKTADLVQTCHNIKTGGREQWLPVKSCGKIAAYFAITETSSLLTEYWLHKHGHHKLERLSMYGDIVQHSIGFTYSFANRHGEQRTKYVTYGTLPDGTWGIIE